MQIYTPIGVGPQIINAYAAVNTNSNWVIDIPEQEAGAAGGSNPVAFRLAGVNNEVKNLSPGTKSGGIVQWDSRASSLDRISIGSYAITFNLTGNINDFFMPNGADNFSEITWAITGYGNTFKTGSQINVVNVQPARKQYAVPTVNALSSSPFGNPTLSRDSIALNRTHDFLSKGASAYYFNDEDLWMCPQEVSDDVGGGTGTPVLTADSTSECGWNFAVNTSGRTNQYVSAANTVNLYIGSQLPASKLRIFFKAKAASSTSITVGATAGSTGLGSYSPTLTTSYAVYSFDVNASSYSGSQFYLNFASVSANVQIAWIGIRPWDSSIIGTNLTVTSSGTPITFSGAATDVAGGLVLLTSAAPTVTTGQVGLGNTTATASNCNQGGTLSSVAGCLVINVAGTTHYVPYF
jgi:hypothetical protein